MKFEVVEQTPLSQKNLVELCKDRDAKKIYALLNEKHSDKLDKIKSLLKKHYEEEIDLEYPFIQPEFKGYPMCKWSPPKKPSFTLDLDFYLKKNKLGLQLNSSGYKNLPCVFVVNVEPEVQLGCYVLQDKENEDNKFIKFGYIKDNLNEIEDQFEYTLNIAIKWLEKNINKKWIFNKNKSCVEDKEQTK